MAGEWSCPPWEIAPRTAKVIWWLRACIYQEELAAARGSDKDRLLLEAQEAMNA